MVKPSSPASASVPTSRTRWLPLLGVGRDSEVVGAGERRAADALQRDPGADALARPDARRQRDAAHERLVGAAVDLQQDVDAGHVRRRAGVGVDRRERAGEVVGGAAEHRVAGAAVVALAERGRHVAVAEAQRRLDLGERDPRAHLAGQPARACCRARALAAWLTASGATNDVHDPPLGRSTAASSAAAVLTVRDVLLSMSRAMTCTGTVCGSAPVRPATRREPVGADRARGRARTRRACRSSRSVRAAAGC